MVTNAPLRVFISYSHEDRPVCDTVRRKLSTAGFAASFDADLKPGQGFTEQIQTRISHAHVFMPIITPRSHARGWVHEEIGFAVAMKVPCVPLCIGNLPDGMIAMAHAIVVSDDLSEVGNAVLKVDLRSLVDRSRLRSPPARVADEPEERARVVEEYANAALDIIGPQTVRIAGGLSTFSLPDEDPDHPKWIAAYADKPRTHHSYELIRAEHQALKRHASRAGLRMVANLGLDLDKQRGAGATRTRLSLLVEFLERGGIPAELAEIAVIREGPPSLILAVGDWFYAESNAPRPGRGVLHTTFITHAPTVVHDVTQFDQRLRSLLEDQGIRREESRDVAVALIKQRMSEFPSHPAWPASTAAAKGDP